MGDFWPQVSFPERNASDDKNFFFQRQKFAPPPFLLQRDATTVQCSALYFLQGHSPCSYNALYNAFGSEPKIELSSCVTKGLIDILRLIRCAQCTTSWSMFIDHINRLPSQLLCR